MLQALQNVLRLCRALFLESTCQAARCPRIGIEMCQPLLGYWFGLKEWCNFEVAPGAKFQRASFFPTWGMTRKKTFAWFGSEVNSKVHQSAPAPLMLSAAPSHGLRLQTLGCQRTSTLARSGGFGGRGGAASLSRHAFSWTALGVVLRSRKYPRPTRLTRLAFENELGVQPPLGFWDPMGFTDDGDIAAYRRRRSVEFKHGRIAMLATMGFMTPEIIGRWPGYLSPSMDLKFSDVPNGLAALNVVPSLGLESSKLAQD